jgi:hypothetical protein
LSSECFWLIFSDLGYFFQLFLKIFGIIYRWYRVCFGSSRVCFGNSRVILDIFWTIFSDSCEKVAQLAGSFFSNPFFKNYTLFFWNADFLDPASWATFFQNPRNSKFEFSKMLIFRNVNFLDPVRGGYMKKMSIWNFENLKKTKCVVVESLKI